ncbi:hypothetical protein P3T16_005846 [Paraburkholderia sp. GAS42]|jgi:hypothetical protein
MAARFSVSLLASGRTGNALWDDQASGTQPLAASGFTSGIGKNLQDHGSS